METALSADGSTLAYDRLGDGPPVILVGGATCTPGYHRPLAESLAAQCTVINFDRRARGDSDDRSGAPYDKQRESEDPAVLIDVAGGHAAIYGHSSGAAVALHATVHRAIAGSRFVHLAGEQHGAGPEVVAPTLLGFLAGAGAQ